MERMKDCNTFSWCRATASAITRMVIVILDIYGEDKKAFPVQLR